MEEFPFVNQNQAAKKTHKAEEGQNVKSFHNAFYKYHPWSSIPVRLSLKEDLFFFGVVIALVVIPPALRSLPW